MTAVSLLQRREARTVNVTDVAPAGMLTELGTRNLDVLERSRTTVFTVGAAARWRVTVPVALLVRTAGVAVIHSAAGATSTLVLSLVEPIVAVMVTVCGDDGAVGAEMLKVVDD
jgi:hypothetical protein